MEKQVLLSKKQKKQLKQKLKQENQILDKQTQSISNLPPSKSDHVKKSHSKRQEIELPHSCQDHKKHQKQENQFQEEDEEVNINFNQLEANNQEQIQVSFLITEIFQKYYHSLKTILLRYAQIIASTNSEIADLIISNKKIGNVTIADDEDSEQEEDQEADKNDQDQSDKSNSQNQKDEMEDDQENVYSILTIIAGKRKIIKKIKQIFLKSAEKYVKKDEILEIIKNQHTNLLLNERLPNLPAFVVQSMHQVFKKDMMEVKTVNNKEFNEHCSSYLLSVSQIQIQNGSLNLENIIFSKFEDYQMCKRSKQWWVGESVASHKKKADLRKLFYVIRCEEYFKGIDHIKDYLLN